MQTLKSGGAYLSSSLTARLTGLRDVFAALCAVGSSGSAGVAAWRHEESCVETLFEIERVLDGLQLRASTLKSGAL